MAATPTRPSTCSTSRRTRPTWCRPRRRALGAARAPARLPHRAGDRLRAGLDGRAARGGRGAHAAGAARRRRAAGGDGARTAAGQPGTACASSSCPAPSRAPRAREHADRRSLRRARRDHRADARARAGVAPARLVHPVPLGLPGGVRRAARWGRWQDGIGVGPAERRVLTRARRGAARAAEGVRPGPGALRPGARRHPAGQPARARRIGQRHRLRRLRVQLVPVRPGHLGELLRALARGAGAWWTAG